MLHSLSYGNNFLTFAILQMKFISIWKVVHQQQGKVGNGLLSLRCLDFLFYYLDQQAQANAVGPSATSHSAAPGVDHGLLGQHTCTSADSETYNGFSKVRYIFIGLSIFFFFFFFFFLLL